MKKALLLLLGFSFTALTSVNAQWTKIGYMVTAANDTSKGCHQFKAAGTNLFCATSKGLYKSTDNGNSWNDITYITPVTAGRDVYSSLLASNGDLFAGTDKRLFKSTTGGSSWTWITTLPDTAIYWDIAEHGGNVVASFSKGAAFGVFYSSDFGGNWKAATGITSNVRYFFSDGTALYVGGTANGVYKSLDDGKTWAIAGTGFPASAGIWSVMRSGSKLFANSVSGVGLFESSDNGATWTSTAPSTFNGFCQVFSIAQSGSTILASNDGACNPGGASAIRTSSDGGSTWSNFTTGLPSGYFPVLGRNASGSSFFTKEGNGAQAFRYDVPTSIIEAKNDDDLTLFPNPASDQITISGNKKGRTIQFQVLDLLGRSLAQGFFEELSLSVPLNGFPSGMYVCKISCENSFSTRTFTIK